MLALLPHPVPYCRPTCLNGISPSINFQQPVRQAAICLTKGAPHPWPAGPCSALALPSSSLSSAFSASCPSWALPRPSLPTQGYSLPLHPVLMNSFRRASAQAQCPCRGGYGIPLVSNAHCVTWVAVYWNCMLWILWIEGRVWPGPVRRQPRHPERAHSVSRTLSEPKSLAELSHRPIR